MRAILQILLAHFLVLFLFTISCQATEEINSTTPLPNPSIKCDACPEPLPPPPPPLPSCPPPPPPPCEPPPPPVEPPCTSCMSQHPPPPPIYYNTPGQNNLYVTGYTYDSSGPRVHDGIGGFMVFVIIVALLEVIILS